MRKSPLLAMLFALPFVQPLATPFAPPTASPGDTPVLSAAIIPARHPAPPPNPNTTLRLVSAFPAPLRNVRLEWALRINGAVTKKGTAVVPFIISNHPILVPIKLRLPDDTAGESFLDLRYSLPHAQTTTLSNRTTTPSPALSARTTTPSPALSAPTTRSNRPAPTPLGRQQLRIHPWHPSLRIAAAGEIELSDSNDIVTIRSSRIRIAFNRQTGWLTHYEINGVKFVDDSFGLRPNFWCAGYNDSAHESLDPRLQLFSNTTSTTQIIIRTEYTLPAIACFLHLSYTINAAGEMLVTQQVEPDTTQPSRVISAVPCFGMQWTLPPEDDSITAYGPDPSDNLSPTPTPWIGIRHLHPAPSAGISAPHADSELSGLRWLILSDANGNGLQFIADSMLLTATAIHDLDTDLINNIPHSIRHPQIRLNIRQPSSVMTDQRRTQPPASTTQEPKTQLATATTDQSNRKSPTTATYRFTYKVKPLDPPSTH